jgi:predicted ATPase
LLWREEFDRAQAHLDQAFAFYDPEQHHDLAYHMGQDPGLVALAWAAWTLWYRGYPDQALERVRRALSSAQALSHPLSLVAALGYVAFVHLLRREGHESQTQAEALLTLAHEHGFALWLGLGTSLQGWALIERASRSGAREQGEAGLVQLREGLAAERASGAEIWVPLFLGAVAQGYGQSGQAEEGLRVIAEALALVEKNEERWNEAELYRIKGELALQKEAGGWRLVPPPKPQVSSLKPLVPSGVEQEAEECFLKAIEIAQRQQAKSLELRATMSLVRLRQQQATQDASRTTQHETRTRLAEAHKMLSELYGWFTEGFDTQDLQEARALLEELS